MAILRVCIASPAPRFANNGNSHTAARWADYLSACAQVQVITQWAGEPCDLLIALHARKSADAIERYRTARAEGRVVLVLTGTDLYRDLPADAAARRSLELADIVVVLQRKALERLPPQVKQKARVIEQSAPAQLVNDKRTDTAAFVAVGHLRDEKRPLTLMRAARRLRGRPPISIEHIGESLDETLAAAARQTMRECPRYHWLGGLAHTETRLHIARSHALVHPSAMEGGANAVIEAIRSRVPVLASRIDGNVGLLGEDYHGYFPVDDDEALAELMCRFAEDPSFAMILQSQCAEIEGRFAPDVEAAAVRQLLQA
jgi:putative glycosyltransferase (TIGR04348 family)